MAAQSAKTPIPPAPEQVSAASTMVWIAALFACGHQVLNLVASLYSPHIYHQTLRDYFGDNLEAEAAKAGLGVDQFVSTASAVGLTGVMLLGVFFFLIYALAGRSIRKGKNWARLFVMFGAFWLGFSVLLSFLRSPDSVFAQGPVWLELVDGVVVICAGVAAIAAQVLLSSKNSVEFFVKAYEAKHGPIERPRTKEK